MADPLGWLLWKMCWLWDRRPVIRTHLSQSNAEIRRQMVMRRATKALDALETRGEAGIDAARTHLYDMLYIGS